jgi:hypothetical protein
VDDALLERLRDRGVWVRRGDVLLAGSASDGAVILEEIHRLGLDCQLVFNRSELMILPAGVTKGSGLFDALGDLGVSRHSAVGVGDAENDHALIDVCEVGVAVSDAVPSLKASADRVLTCPNGAGIVELLRMIDGPDPAPMHSRRWRVHLGTALDGSPVSIPSSQVNVLVCGESGEGKSFLAGLMAEGLIAQGYTVLIVDPEGDHAALDRLRGVVVVDGRDGLPSPDRIIHLLNTRFTSVVLDMSMVPECQRHDYLRDLAVEVERSRAEHGLPHWVIADEAHISTAGLQEVAGFGTPTPAGRWGYCLISYRPDLIEPEPLALIDAVIALGPTAAASPFTTGLLAEVSRRDEAGVADLLRQVPRGGGLLVTHPRLGPPSVFSVGSRFTEHRRHLRKYAQVQLPDERAFHMRDGEDHVVGVAGDFTDLVHLLQACPDSALEHHADHCDLSRWIGDVFADRSLAAAVAAIERHLADGSLDCTHARQQVMDSVRRAYHV